MENITKFKDISNKHNNTININMCLMRHNWNEIPHFLEFCSTNNFTLNVIPIEYPEVLSIGNLSAKIIDEILSFYKEFYLKTEHKKIVESIINSIANYRRISKERHELLNMLIVKDISEIELDIKELLKPYLSTIDIQKLITQSYKKLENLDSNTQKTIFVNTYLDYRSIKNLEENTADIEKRVFNEFLYYLDLELYFLKSGFNKTI